MEFDPAERTALQNSENPDLSSILKQLDWHDTYGKYRGEWNVTDEDCLIIMVPIPGDCMSALSDIHISAAGVVSASLHELQYNYDMEYKKLSKPLAEMKSAVFTLFVPKGAITSEITGAMIQKGDCGVTSDSLSDAYTQFSGICAQKQTVTVD